MAAILRRCRTVIVESSERAPRAMCSRCTRPSSVCLCASLVEIDTFTRVLILQHPRESDVPIGTAKLAELALRNAERHVGVEFSECGPVQRALSAADAPPILLYPGRGAKSLERDAPRGKLTLVVIDGTWWQAAKIMKRNPELLELPRYALNPDQPSRYRIRREPERHCLSTIEAIVQALSVLEPEGSRVHAALGPFDALVEMQLAFASQRGARRHVERKCAPRRPQIPAAFRTRSHDLLVMYAEASAWPRGTPLGAHPEIVHVAAERPFTGERFEALIAPRRLLSPSFTYHTGIAERSVAAGESWDSFCRRWTAFTRPSDLLCVWGYYASRLLEADGAPLPERLELRALAERYLRRKPGDVLECAAALGENVRPSSVPGRTGVRLDGLLAVVRALARVNEASDQ